MPRTSAIVVGAGQAGLAMSRCLDAHGIDHVVLERGRVAERWRSERWDSLRLLTPNWMSRLPGWHYAGGDPDGFMTRSALVDFLARYAAASDAPIQAATRVERIAADGAGYRIDTDRGTWRAPVVVLATGACDRAAVPAWAAGLPPRLFQAVPTAYRRPGDLPAQGVLVVGASATAVQLAEELQLSGRPVTLAVGRHTRLPRRYRGHDILAWLERTGALDRPAGAIPDLARARRAPSLQGRTDGQTLDLGRLQRLGVRLVGRALDGDGGRARLSPNLPDTLAEAQQRLERTLDRIDAIAEAAPPADPAARAPIVADPGPAVLDLAAEGIASVVWATGFRRDYGWLQVPVLGPDGELRQAGGVTEAPGLYGLGLPFLRRRKSTFIDGVGDDARALAAHAAAYLGARTRTAA
jgi:putative flavoprotein involved in K+ transport